MRSIARFRINSALPCAAVLLLSGTANAVPRGEEVEYEPPTPEEREALRQLKNQDIDAWLPRLVGRFQTEGVFHDEPEMSPIEGLVDCVAVGEGPGVQCVMHLTWGGTGDSDLGPAALLYGTNPNAGMVRFMLLNNLGIPRDGPARLKNDTVFWDGESGGVHTVVGNVRVRAPAESNFVQMTFYDGNMFAIVNLHMRRLPEDQPGKASETPPARE